MKKLSSVRFSLVYTDSFLMFVLCCFTKVDNKEMWLEWGSTVDDGSVVVTSRININHAEEWITKPLRFYILGNSCVSVCDRLAEKEPVAN